MDTNLSENSNAVAKDERLFSDEIQRFPSSISKNSGNIGYEDINAETNSLEIYPSNNSFFEEEIENSTNFVSVCSANDLIKSRKREISSTN
ncbi:unnamed protein product [[Candida] boidinii]|uniref:Unnamed protein product n=1 Tax=Candida boidinii TaxID=5477 RepID=A0A9W6WLG2_CANBO|nr:unnamed protein product [[Candida] boidinii]